MVDGRLHAEGITTPFEIEIVGNELVVVRIFAHDVGLPLQEGAHLVAAELVELTAEGFVDGRGHIREVLPGVHTIGPVVEAKVMVHLIEVAIEFLVQVFDEQTLHVVGDRIVVLGLVIHLIADDRRMVGHVGDEPADHALTVETVGGVNDIHDLACAVFAFAVRGDGEHARVELDEPAGHGVGRRTDDDVDVGALGRVEGAVHIGEVEFARLGFAGAPRGFGDANHVEPGVLHHPHILIDTIDALHHEVFVVVGGAEKDMVHAVATHGSSFCCLP